MMLTQPVPKRLNKAAFFKSLGYEPHEGQLRVHLSKASRRVLCCGARWGKSLCGAVEGLAAATKQLQTIGEVGLIRMFPAASPVSTCS